MYLLVPPLQPYQVTLQEFRATVGQEESSKTFFVDVEADIVTTVAPDFKGTEYENGITTVKGIMHTCKCSSKQRSPGIAYTHVACLAPPDTCMFFHVPSNQHAYKCTSYILLSNSCMKY